MVKKINQNPKENRAAIRETKLIKNNINKKPYSDKERAEMLRRDRLDLARRYEDLKLFDDSIKYYGLLGMASDVERLTKIKHETYLEKAREYEAACKYEDAIRLYENLKMHSDVDRLQKFVNSEGPDTSASDEVTLPTPELDNGLEDMINAEVSAAPGPNLDQNKKVNGNKPFKICPYCGEELNLPKTPKFCPFCQESFV